MDTLTGAWNWRTREQYLVDTFPRYSPGVRYQAHLVLVYSLYWLGLMSFTPLFCVCMQSHLCLALHHNPTPRAVDWRTMISLEMLPEHSSIRLPYHAKT